MLGKVTVALLFVVMIWGNLVAGLKAGLGCPDWPLCHGKIVPPFRFDVWMEFTHRIIAATTAISLCLLAWRRFRDYSGIAKGVPMAAAGLLLFQVVMGGMVVLLEIPVELTTFHFMTALVIFLLSWYMMIFDGNHRAPAFSVSRLSALFFVMTIFMCSQAALGAYVRHSQAGLSCSDFPTCMGVWFPHILNWLVLVHLSHRFVGLMLLLTFVALYAATFVEPKLAIHRNSAFILLVLCAAQIAVGGTVVLSGLSFVATAIHLAVALTILSILFMMWAREVTRKQDIPQEA